MAMTLEHEREAFEQWVRKYTDFDLGRRADGEYAYGGAKGSWKAWQGRASLAHFTQSAQAVDALEMIEDVRKELSEAAPTSYAEGWADALDMAADKLSLHLSGEKPAQAVDVGAIRGVTGRLLHVNEHGLSQDVCHRLADKLTRAIGTAQGWRDIASAPKDGRLVLLLFKSAIHLPELYRGFADAQFVGTWQERDSDWSFAAPVGCGGIPDEWIVGWLPTPPTDGEG